MNAREFDYYRNLHQTVCHALLHLHFHLLSSKRFVPVPKRNELLLRYLKPKLKDKRLSNIKKDLRECRAFTVGRSTPYFCPSTAP
ncbi:DUF2913 family protein [Vibrio owensii]|uniref:DUF2913 family protein n=1 Tax=Vibrio owensii TaxID=696485 RepID=UPI003DA0D275